MCLEHSYVESVFYSFNSLQVRMSMMLDMDYLDGGPFSNWNFTYFLDITFG